MNFQNSTADLEFDSIIVVVEDSLVHTKSGDRYPKNVADFIPDYNLWYAFRGLTFKDLWVTENQDLTRWGWNRFTLSENHTRYEFLKVWLSQIIGHPRLECHCLYSIRGDWNLSWAGDNILETIRDRSRGDKILFIDRDTRENEDTVKALGFKYMTTSEFIKTYNKNPRVYEKPQNSLRIASNS